MRKDRRRHEYAAIDPHLSGEKTVSPGHRQRIPSVEIFPAQHWTTPSL